MADGFKTHNSNTQSFTGNLITFLLHLMQFPFSLFLSLLFSLMVLILLMVRCLLASAARSWSGGTRTARGRRQMPLHLLVVGVGNSSDLGPARLKQEARWGARWRLQPIGEEIVRYNRHHRCSL